MTKFAVIYLALALSACSSAEVGPVSPSGYHGVELENPIPKPDMVFIDTRGEPYPLVAKTAGKVTLLFFGYTNCPDICPVHLANIAAVLNKLPDAIQRDVMMVFVTTDPKRDSLPRLHDWVKGFHAEFVGLSGTDSVLAAAQHALGLHPAVIDTVTPTHGGNAYLVGHAGQVIAFTRDGLARVMYPFGTRQRDWAADLPKLVAFEADE
jgi:protein SCO1/2